MNEQQRKAVEYAEQLRADDARHRAHRASRGPSLRPADVTLTLTREQAEKLYEHLGSLPFHGDAWAWSLTPWITLADALGHSVPDGMRERATA
jgi:hypothetical protein